MAAAPFVFLSHTGADTEAAQKLKDRLLAGPDARAAGLRVWFDKDDLRPGTSWSAQIAEAIQQATAFVVYVGSGGVMNWVEAEVDLALSRATTDKQSPLLFIPVLADKSAGSSALPPFAKRYQGVRDPLVRHEELEKLLKAVLNADWDKAAKLIDESTSRSWACDRCGRRRPTGSSAARRRSPNSSRNSDAIPLWRSSPTAGRESPRWPAPASPPPFVAARSPTLRAPNPTIASGTWSRCGRAPIRKKGCGLASPKRRKNSGAQRTSAWAFAGASMSPMRARRPTRCNATCRRAIRRPCSSSTSSR